MKRGIFLAIALVVIVLASRGGTAQAAILVAGGDTYLEVFADVESWLSFNNTIFSELPAIPGDTFDVGCNDFVGIVPVTGSPLDPPNLGTTDTIIRRPDVDFAVIPGLKTVDIEIVALSLQSVAPIQVNCPGGVELWDVSVTLDPASLPAPGRMNIHHSDPAGGLIDLNAFPCFQVDLTRGSDGAVRTMLPCEDGFDPLFFGASGVPWVHGCPPGALCDPDSDFFMPAGPNFPIQGPNGSLLSGPPTAPESAPGTGTVIIQKVTDPPGSAGVFGFTHNIGGGGSFDLSDGSQEVFTDVAPGSYNVTEQDIDGFVFINYECIEPVGSNFGPYPSANFQVVAGGTTTCTFTNVVDTDNDNVGNPTDVCPGTLPGAVVNTDGCSASQLTGTVVIWKVTDPADSVGVFSFTHDIGGGGAFDITCCLLPQVFLYVDPGVYTVTETPTQGFMFYESECVDAVFGTFNSADPETVIEVSAGVTTTCTYTNKVDSDNDGVPNANDDCSDIDPYDTPTPVDEVGCADGQVDGDGDGVCNADAPSGGPSQCTGSDLCPGTLLAVPVNADGCSSSQLLGTVIIEKVTEPPGSLEVFSFTHDIGGGGAFDLSDGGLPQVFLDVVPGTYTVTEAQAAGFTVPDWLCGDPDPFGRAIQHTAVLRVSAGVTTTCTFTNRKNKIDPQVAEAVANDGQAYVVIKLDYPTLAEQFPGQPITEDLFGSWLLGLDNIKANKLAELGDDFHRTDSDRAGAYLVGDVKLGALEKLQNNEHVVRVSLNQGGGSGHLADSVPLIDADQWHADGVTGAGVLVAVIDSGIDTGHADLSDDLVFQQCFGDGDGAIDGAGFCPGGSDRQAGPGSAEDDQSHGSHVAGIVTSKGTVSSVGVAPDAEIVAIKVLDNLNNFYYFSEILAALNFVIVNHPGTGGLLDVELVNMSLGTNALFDSACDASNAWNMAGASSVSSLRALGVSVFASSGNDSSTTSMSSPACLSEVISVGATEDLDNVAGFTNSNASTDLMAPGVGIVSTDNTGSTAVKSGTSMASPHAVGCAALLIEAGVVADPAEIEARLKDSPVQVSVGPFSFPRIDCRIPSDRPSVGGSTSFVDGGDGSSAWGAMPLAGALVAVLAVSVAGAWQLRKRRTAN